MSTTQPIRSLEEIEELKDYFFTKKSNMRNYALICLGINSALRISDLLALEWKDVYDFAGERFMGHITLVEKKTGKYTQIALNKSAVEALSVYKDTLDGVKPGDYIFTGRDAGSHLSRSQAFRLIRDAGRELNFEHEISCHSLRKTFGYHAWKSGVHPIIIMMIYNHSSFQVTKRYIGVEQDDKDQVFLDLNL
ncbi:tyrosine-type recombinase/integrase [Lachnospiraceae bacterium 29-84]